MKTTVKFIEKPFCMEFGMFSKPEQFLTKIMEEKAVNVNVNFETKTSCNISLYLSPFNFQINTFVAPELKYLQREENNYFEYSKTVKHYLKPKSIADIVKHIEYVLNKAFDEVNDIIELRIYKTEFINSLTK